MKVGKQSTAEDNPYEWGMTAGYDTTTTQTNRGMPFLHRKSFEVMAGTTRLELATSAVTGQRSNQLNYVPANVHLLVGGHGFEPRTFPV